MAFLDWTTHGYSSASGMRNALCDAAVEHQRTVNYSNYSICQRVLGVSFNMFSFLKNKELLYKLAVVGNLLLTALENGSFWHRIAGINTSVFTIAVSKPSQGRRKLFKFCPCSVLGCFFLMLLIWKLISLDRKCASTTRNFYRDSPCNNRTFNCC